MRHHFRSLAPLIAVLAVTGCGAPPDDGTIPAAGGTPDQQAALQALEDDTGSPWTVRWHRDVHTPAVLEGRTAPLAMNTAAAEKAAYAFLAKHGDVFLLRGAPEDELYSDASDADELGMTHVRLHQQVSGLPVWGHEIKVHFADSGALVRVDGRYAPLAQLDRMTPVVTTDEARANALIVGAPQKLDGAADVSVEAPSLIVDPTPGDVPGTLVARLAWRVEVIVTDPSAPARREVFLDAATGEAYRVTNILDQLHGSGKGVFGEAQEFEILAKGKRFELEDKTAGSPAQKVYTAKWGSRLPGTLVGSDRADHWDEAGDGSGSAVDAAVYMAATGGYYAHTHGRKGALGKGAGMRATVHFGRGYANAFWNGHQLVFGDGDGAQFAPLAGALDVVAHEFTHAVSESSAHLGHSGEAGALNEAVSDVFGCFVEHAVRKNGANWTVGEEVMLGKAGKYGMRDLADPKKTRNPAHVREQSRDPDDNGGIHQNSTIPSHAAFLMTEGGTNRVSGVRVSGIGQTAAERIWYRALTRYLGPSSDFHDAADATVTAAKDLFGGKSKEVDAVTSAWQAVGVLTTN